MAQVTQLPRPLLIALIGAAAVGALMFATRRGGESETTSAPATQSQTTGAGSEAPSGSGSSSATQSGSQGGAGAGAAKSESPAARTLPAPVDRAIDAKKVVVLLFWNPKAVDDQSVRQSVGGISTRDGKVAKFSDTLDNLARYTKVTGTQSVTQTPAVVVVDRQGNGQVATGYLDTETIDQLVVDALR